MPRGLSTLLALVLATVASLVILARLSGPRDLPPELVSTPRPLIVDARLELMAGQGSGTLDIAWSNPQLLSSPTEGVVGWLPSVGTILSTGDTVATVDGMGRILAATPEPLWRPLISGTRGRDVALAATLLSELGYDTDPGSDLANTRFIAATRALALDLGMDRDSARRVNGLDPAWLVWSPTPEVQVAEWKVAVGDSVGTGDPLIAGPTRVDTWSATVTSASSPLPMEVPYPISRLETYGGPWLVEVTMSDTVLFSHQAETPAAGLELALPLLPATDAVLSWTAVLLTPVELVVIPMSALQSGASGSCVLSDDGVPTPVEVVSTSLATVAVSGIEAGHRVLANPAQVYPDRVDLCASQ